VHCEKCTSQDKVAEPLNSHYRQITVSKSICYSAPLLYITLLKHATSSFSAFYSLYLRQNYT